MFSERRRCFALLLPVCLIFGAALSAQETEQPDETPRIALCNPLLLESNSTSEMVIRGWHLSDITDVQSDLDGITIKILKQEAAAVPGRQDAKEIGDTQLRIEITTPAIASPQRIHLIVKNSKGQSSPHAIQLGSPFPLANDQEQNDGFRDAQPIAPRQSLRGEIHQDRNVDVFAIEGREGQSLKLNLCARELGSALDGLLTVYDEGGRILASNDDVNEAHEAASTDSQLQLQLPAAGRFYLCLQDAHDRGGPAHPWILHVELSDD